MASVFSVIVNAASVSPRKINEQGKTMV